MIRKTIATGLILATCLLTTGIPPLGRTVAGDRSAEIFNPSPFAGLRSKVNESTESSQLEDALNAPPAVLAKRYLWRQMILSWLPLPPGVTIVVTGPSRMSINADNQDSVRKEFSSQLAIYETAINTRGYASIAGPYQAAATESCQRTQTSWAAMTQMQI